MGLLGGFGPESEGNPYSYGSLYKNLCMMPGVDLGRYERKGGDAPSGWVVDKLTKSEGDDQRCLLQASVGNQSNINYH